MINWKGLLVICLLVVMSCQEEEDKQPMDQLFGQWEVVAIYSDSVEGELEKTNGFNPIITFKTDLRMDIQLDVNSAGGVLEYPGNNEINVVNSWSTDACCDSEFSEKFLEKLQDLSHFSFPSKDRAELHAGDWGYFELWRLN